MKNTEIRTNPMRLGKITSSQIASLMSEPTAAAKKEGQIIGKPGLTYISEKNMERRLGLPLTADINARPTSWGKLVEAYVFQQLGTEYQDFFDKTFPHPTIDCWCGSPDGVKHDDGKTVVDIKSPVTRKSFCQLSDCKTIEEVREAHTEGDTYYYQLISNAIIMDCRYAELIIFMPYFEQISEIVELASRNDTPAQKNYYWIANCTSYEELPYILKDGYYKNIHTIRFEVTDEMKAALTNRVVISSGLLKSL
jgi:hypothetical protein